MCGLIITRRIPKKDLKKIAHELRVNIIIRTIDETRDTRHQMLCDCDKLLNYIYIRIIIF